MEPLATLTYPGIIVALKGTKEARDLSQEVILAANVALILTLECERGILKL